MNARHFSAISHKVLVFGQEEINALFPRLNIPERTTALEEQEVDLFLVYTAIQIDHLRKAIKSIEVRFALYQGHCVFFLRQNGV